MTHCWLASLIPREAFALGSARFTMDASSTTISWAIAMTPRARHRVGSGTVATAGRSSNSTRESSWTSEGMAMRVLREGGRVGHDEGVRRRSSSKRQHRDVAEIFRGAMKTPPLIRTFGCGSSDMEPRIRRTSDPKPTDEPQIQSAGSWNIASYGSWPLSGKRIVAGTPVATAPAGMSLTTTELAPICTWSPMYTGPRTRAPAPMVTWLPTVGGRLTRFIERPPRVTPWYINTSSPISAVSPMTTPMPWSMKKRRPICAPGWISTPVIARVSCEISRAAKRPPGLFHSRCESRCTQMACNPGEVSAISRRESTAGSRSIAASRSSRTRARAERHERVDRPRGSGGVTARSIDVSLVKRRAVIGAAPFRKMDGDRDRTQATRTGSGEQVGEEDGGQVALTEGRDDHHDELARVLGPAGNLVGCRECSAGRDTDQQTLFLRSTPRPLNGGLGIDVDDLVVDLTVEDLGHEVGTEALNLVRAGSTAVEDRGLFGLDADDLDLGVASLEDLADARDGATSANACDEDVDCAVGVLPDLFRGGLAVDLWVGLIRELAGQNAATLGDDLLGLGDRALHPLGAGGQDELGTERPQQRLALLTHRLRHGEHDVVSTGGAHHRQRDTGVATGRLHDRSARFELAGTLGGVDDRHADPVLHGTSRVLELELGGDRRSGTRAQPVDPDERGVADDGGDVVMNGQWNHLGCVGERRILSGGTSTTSTNSSL